MGGHSPPTLVLVGGVRPRGVPLDRLGRRASDGRPSGYGPLDAVSVVVVREVGVEDRAEVAPLFRGGRVVREADCRGRHVVIRYDACRVLLQPVDPRVADAVGELLLLPPQDFFRQIRRVLRVRAEMWPRCMTTTTMAAVTTRSTATTTGAPPRRTPRASATSRRIASPRPS